MQVWNQIAKHNNQQNTVAPIISKTQLPQYLIKMGYELSQTLSCQPNFHQTAKCIKSNKKVFGIKKKLSQKYLIKIKSQGREYSNTWGKWGAQCYTRLLETHRLLWVIMSLSVRVCVCVSFTSCLYLCNSRILEAFCLLWFVSFCLCLSVRVWRTGTGNSQYREF